MQKTTIPLILPSTARGWEPSIGSSAKDQQLLNAVYVDSASSLSGSKVVYAQKRSGSTTSSTISSALLILKDSSLSGGSFYTANSPRQLYIASTALGVITNGIEPHTNLVLANSIVSGEYVIAFVTSEPAGWFLFESARSNNFPTFTADTHSNTTIDNIGGTGAATTGIYVGQLVTGTGIPANTRVATVSATSFTITNAATATATITVTKEAVAKIIDAQFPSDANSIESMDGYFFAGSDAGVIYQSAINDPSSWSSSDVINADYEGDKIRFIFKWENYIVAAGAKGTIQYFYNAGNSSGSVLSPAENLNVAGVTLMSRPVAMGRVGYCTAYTNKTVNGNQPVSLYALSGVNNYQPISDSCWSGVISSNSMLYVDNIASGRGNYILVRPNAGTTTPVLYDPSTGQFSALLLGTAITSAFGDSFTKSGADTVFLFAEDDTWTDSNSAYTLTAQTQPYTLNEGASFIINSVDLIADTEASGTATLYISEDDYTTWQNCGTFDMTQQIKRIDGIGWLPSNVAFKVEHSANTNFRAQALAVNWTPCGR